jgi:hypothetical protein
MTLAVNERPITRPTHAWLRHVHVAYVPGQGTPLIESVAGELLNHFRLLGHHVQAGPDASTDVILTTALFGEAMNWRDSVLLTGRRRFQIDHMPTVFTLIHATPAKFQETLDHFEKILAKEPPDPNDFAFPGLAPQAHRILIEQGRRGGPIMSLERLLQAQSKSIRILLVVGDDRPRAAYHFDLVGAFPRSEGDDPAAFYSDMVLRMVTSVSTSEVVAHEVMPEPITRATWNGLTTPAAMRNASLQLGKRDFFTEMVVVADLVAVPAVSNAVADQYSEGCYATWDPRLNALIATITGSARPVDKGNVTDNDLAVIVGVRPDGRGAQVRHVQDKFNTSPSSEAVEMMDMDNRLPKITLGAEWGADASARVPVVRSKLHGHRGIGGYDPRRVEFVRLDPPYYHFPVSCATEAQAQGIKEAFARAESLRNPDDPRQVAFTVLPGHGCVIVEKWVAGKEPFEVLWEYMDAGWLEVVKPVPQGTMEYVPDPNGKLVLEADQ